MVNQNQPLKAKSALTHSDILADIRAAQQHYKEVGDESRLELFTSLYQQLQASVQITS